jgi:flavin-dependent dehydrogenase
MLVQEEHMVDSAMQLSDGSRIGVVGGGPAGSFFSILVLDLARRMGLDLNVDIYEPRNYNTPGPPGCNMCGGIISETLVQNLAAEGIPLPPTVVQRGIDSYNLHMDVGSVLIETPLQEKRIGAVYRGPGPRDIKEIKWGSFDGHLLKLAQERGAHIIQERVTSINRQDGRPQVEIRKGEPQTYDLLTVATGVNAATKRILDDLEIEYELPDTTKTHIREFFMGEQAITETLGTSMHVFLLDIPRLEFAAIIPKGDYVSLCLLGDEIDKELIDEFLAAPEVRQCFPADWDFEKFSCQCSPRINTKGASQPFADRIVFVGDIGVTRLYKDGIGAAYRTAKAAASTVVFQGISAEDFKKHFLPVCKKIESDNSIGKLMFVVTEQIQSRRFARKAVLHMTEREQTKAGEERKMSTVLWDMFTGSAPYREIFIRTLKPSFWLRLVGELSRAIFSRT